MTCNRERAASWSSILAFLVAGIVVPATAMHDEVHKSANSAPIKKAKPTLAIGAAFAPDGALWIVGLNDDKRLFVQTSNDDGRSWQPQRVVDTGQDKIAADGENRPKIAFGNGKANGVVVITYTEPLAKPFAGRIRMLRSGDGGETFSAPFTVHRDTQEITHRFESVAFDAQGKLHTIWIDKRDLELAKQAAMGDSKAMSKGKSGYRGAAIYRNVSNDGGVSFGPDIKVADHSCECCRIALASDAGGKTVALWRHVFAPNERDHAFAKLDGEPLPEPVRASFDRWALDACPHHGPGLSATVSGGFHAVWFGVRDGVAAVRYGQLDATGAPRGEVRALPDTRAEHAMVQSDGSFVVIVWRHFDGEKMRWRAWVSNNDGRNFQLRELGASSDDNDHPLLIKKSRQIYALWRTTEGVRVEAIVP